MSVRLNSAALPYPPPVPPALSGPEGELVMLRIVVEPRRLEQLLDTLASTDFHINPQVIPAASEGSVVEFPAYEGWVRPIREALRLAGLSHARIDTLAMLAAIAR